MGLFFSSDDGKKRTAKEKANRYVFRMFCRVVACGYISYLIKKIYESTQLEDASERMPMGFAIPVIVVFAAFVVLFAIQVVKELIDGFKNKKFSEEGYTSDFAEEEIEEGELFDPDDFEKFLKGEGELAELARRRAEGTEAEEASPEDEDEEPLCEEDDELDDDEL